VADADAAARLSVHNVVALIIGTESVLRGISTPGADIDVSTLATCTTTSASPTSAGSVT
jgi:hypothetical protein